MVELSQPKQNSSGVEAHGRVSNSPNYLCHLKTWKKIQCHFENMEENSASLQDAFERFRLKRKVEVFTRPSLKIKSFFSRLKNKPASHTKILYLQNISVHSERKKTSLAKFTENFSSQMIAISETGW